MVLKGSTPWSTRTVAEGGTDSPVGDLVPVPDSAQPVINAGFIDESGKWRISAASDDREFTFQDPNQALAAGADMEFDVDMLKHNMVVVGILDSSGNTINVDLFYKNPTTLTGPYNAPPFQAAGVNGSAFWLINDPIGGTTTLNAMLEDESNNLTAAWQFFKIIGVYGMPGRFIIHNNDGSNAGTISTAYLRLV